jgi:hypothetical protein
MWCGRFLMGETKHTTFRLPDTDIKALDKEARRLSKETGISVSRTAVLKKLIRQSLRPEKKQ